MSPCECKTFHILLPTWVYRQSDISLTIRHLYGPIWANIPHATAVYRFTKSHHLKWLYRTFYRTWSFCDKLGWVSTKGSLIPVRYFFSGRKNHCYDNFHGWVNHLLDGWWVIIFCDESFLKSFSFAHATKMNHIKNLNKQKREIMCSSSMCPIMNSYLQKEQLRKNGKERRNTFLGS